MTLNVPQLKLPEFVTTVKRDNCYTPDLNYLESMFSYLPVFVYGTTQKGFSQEHAMGKYARVGSGYTFGSGYVMKITPDGEPAVFFDPYNNHASRVYGELFIVPVGVLQGLDGNLCTGLHFQRRWETIVYHTEGVPLSAPEFSTDAIMWITSENPIWQQAKLVNHNRLMGTMGAFYRFTRLDDIPNKRAQQEEDRDVRNVRHFM